MEEKKNNKVIIVSVLLSLIFGYIGGGIAVRQGKNTSGSGVLSGDVKITDESPIVGLVKKSVPAVVSIVVTDDVNKYLNNFDLFDPFGSFGFFGGGGRRDTAPNFQQVGAGTGFFVTGDGIILTNKHVVSNETAKYTVITSDKKQYEAKVLARDPRSDLAIVKIDVKDTPFLSLADSASIEIGQRVIAIGNSLGQYPNTVTSGIISGIGRSISAASSDGREDLDGVIQTDAAINPGNSGGPLLDVAGQVVGINTAVDRGGQLVGFALPSSEAKRALESYQKNGKISRVYLGVRYLMLNKEIANQNKLPKDYGALIARGDSMDDFAVLPGSPADKAGLRENDIILEADGKKIDIDMTLARVIKNKKEGDELKLKIYSKGDEKEVVVKLEEAK